MTDFHSVAHQPQRGSNQHGGLVPANDPEHARSVQLVKDPVCGMDADPQMAKDIAEHAGKTYYFCAAGCRTRFIADPLKYLEHGSAAAAPVVVPEGTIYACPMHPEFRQVGPGCCPICGAVSAVRRSAVTVDRRGRDGVVVGQRHRYCPAADACESVGS